MYELMIAKSNKTLPLLLSDNVSKIREIQGTINALNSIDLKGNRTLSDMLAEQESHLRYQRGYTLGLLKALIDTLPPQIAEEQKFANVPLSTLIKLKIDDEVLNKLEVTHPPFAPDANASYWSNYRRYSELICGYGYNMTFLQSRFEECYPAGIHNFVSGFAAAYSTAFHVIAAESGLRTEWTEPTGQDIWKNWLFFHRHEVSEYRLDGSYLFMCHGGFNYTGDKSIRYQDNVRVVNTDVYEKLQRRPLSDFSPHEFTDLNF